MSIIIKDLFVISPLRKGKQINVTLSANANHLESQYPIVEGETRARQEISGYQLVIPIVVHGDAAGIAQHLPLATC